MATASSLLEEANSLRATDQKRAEQIYRQILETSAQAQGSAAEREQNLPDQETAVVSLGELYRDDG